MRRVTLSLMLSAVVVAALAAPANADHTDPSTKQAANPGSVTVSPAQYARGEGAWKHLGHFAPNPGTDLDLFRKSGAVYAASGTLGQGAKQHVGQRITQLMGKSGVVQPTWVADHGSAACDTSNPAGTTGLQHDVAVTPTNNAQVLIDTTDATGRCHDAAGGGLELVDVSGLGEPGFKPREIHLTRHLGTSHTVTVDAERPWIIYNSTSDFAGRPWIDVLDISSCMGNGRSLEQKRAECRPAVFRIPFEDSWSSQRDADGKLRAGSAAACHDITAVGERIYCAGLNATLIFDVSGLTDPETGKINGTPLECTVKDGTNTAAKVTDCTGASGKTRAAEGWTFLGSYNHPGRDDRAGGTQGNSNFNVRSDDGVAVAHEADPTPDGKHLFVTDERGGGVVPGGASCAPGVDNPYGNGGIHVLDISDPANITYAKTPTGQKAVWISDELVPAPTFCTVHVIEQIPGEQRLIVGYYSQGTKIVDYFIDEDGRWTFKEVASLNLPGAQTWAVEDFEITKNANGTNTYYLMSSDIARGIDVVSWTGKPNPIGATAPAAATSGPALPMDAGALAFGFLAVPAVAATVGRRRRQDRG